MLYPSATRCPMTLLETTRLHLRRFTWADLEDLHRLDTTEEVMRYIIPGRTREETEKYLTDVIADYDRMPEGLGRWVIIERETGAFAGVAIFKTLDGTAHIEVGYRFFPAFWGRGYATEVTRALLRHGFETLGLPQIVGATDPLNDASQHVLEKCGLRYVRMIEHLGRPWRFSTLDNPALPLA